MNRFIEEIQNRILIYDGSKGYMLQREGLTGEECSEMWNTSHPDRVKKVYSLYKNAGSDVIQTNTFPGNRVHLAKYGIADRTYELNYKGASLAREVMGEGFVSASIGPTGMLFEPSGELTFEYAYEVFKEQVKAVADGGVDIINFETFTDIAEMRAALLAAKDVCNLPVICSMTFEANGRTLMGTDPYNAGMICKSLGAAMIGTNCSFGAEAMTSVVEAMSQVDGIFLSIKPNAGLPEVIDGKTTYKETAEKFASFGKVYASLGGRLIGGCCGTTPEFISKLKETLGGVTPVKRNGRKESIISSTTKYISLEKGIIENTGRVDAALDRQLGDALRNGKLEAVEDLAMDLAAEGYDAVCVSLDSLSGSDELLSKVVEKLQGYVREPLILETSNSGALEKALRIYRGIAGVVAGDGGNLEAIKLVAEKYGSRMINSDTIK